MNQDIRDYRSATADCTLWQCHRCGRWIPNGEYHACGPWQPTPIQYGTSDEIVVLLREIRDLLKTLRGVEISG